MPAIAVHSGVNFPENVMYSCKISAGVQKCGKLYLYLHLEIQKWITMGVTQLKRKSRKNRAIANNKIDAIKRLTLKPTIKKVTVEELKAEAAK